MPVLATRVADWLVTDPRGLYWDATVGAAGHARVMAERLAEGGKLFGSDRDPKALELAAAALTGVSATLVGARFSELSTVWRRLANKKLNGMLFDFGIGSYQLDDATRGVSFEQDGPLDMRLDDRGVPLHEWLNQAPAAQIETVLRRYGEERNARAIARAIDRSRPLYRTAQLRAAVESVTSPRYRNKTLARVFQAFRIRQNNELEEIEAGLAATRELLAPGGRVAAISYHSLEDRMVKHFFRDAARACLCPPSAPACVCGHQAWLKVLTRRPEVPEPTEVTSNRRARSARLRVAERI